jgi:hypothetical protein
LSFVQTADQTDEERSVIVAVRVSEAGVYFYIGVGSADLISVTDRGGLLGLICEKSVRNVNFCQPCRKFISRVS